MRRVLMFFAAAARLLALAAGVVTAADGACLGGDRVGTRAADNITGADRIAGLPLELVRRPFVHPRRRKTVAFRREAPPPAGLGSRGLGA